MSPISITVERPPAPPLTRDERAHYEPLTRDEAFTVEPWPAGYLRIRCTVCLTDWYVDRSRPMYATLKTLREHARSHQR